MKEKKKGNIIPLLIIVIVVLIIVVGLILGKSINGNDKNKENNKEENTKLEKLTGKQEFSKYCNKSETCKKEIGIVTINNKDLKLSVNIENFNTNKMHGTISLGSNKLTLPGLEESSYTKSLDGIEVYKDYLIVYTSELKALEYASCDELNGIREYQIFVFDSEGKEKTGLTGYTIKNAFSDIKIEDDNIYYYSIASTGKAITYNKISFDDFLNRNWEAKTIVKNAKECK